MGIWSNPMAFELRDLADYKRYGRVAWALESNGEELGPNSRGCPASSLSFVIANEFFEEWMAMQRTCKWKLPEDNVQFIDYAPWATDLVLRKDYCGGAVAAGLEAA